MAAKEKDYKEIIMLALAAWGVVTPIGIILYLIITGTDVSPLLAGFVGVIVGTYPQIYNYYYGSSSGSKSKQEALDELAGAKTAAPVVEEKK